MKNKTIFLLLVASVVFNAAKSFGWKLTHETISEYAAIHYWGEEFIGRTLLSNGIQKKIKQLIMDGAMNEDAGSIEDALTGKARYLNHFHNPLETEIAKMGLSDLGSGMSFILWGQDGATQSTEYTAVGGDQSWGKVRDHYYNSLITIDDTQRQEAETLMYIGLGHQMHLVQDASQPDHVRNDTHALDGLGFLYFETWTAKEDDFVRSKIAGVLPAQKPQVDLNTVPNVFNGNVPITQLMDTRNYVSSNAPSTSLTQGLAEYTNANFFSDDTIFANERFALGDKHYFPNPKASATDIQLFIEGKKSAKLAVALDGKTDKGVWISKVAEDKTIEIEHFVRPSYWTKPIQMVTGGGSSFYKSFYLDEFCYTDYLMKLVPRAVGYSATLLSYFFRGTLEISPPDQYVYAITDGSQTPYAYTGPSGAYQGQAFTQIKAKVKNTTPKEKDAQGNILSYEEAQTGELVAVARYKRRTDYTTTLSTDPPTAASLENDYTYSVSTPLAVSALSTTPTEYTFDFSASPVPAGITDLSLQVVFKGTLGGEAEKAVAVGSKDLMEPVQQTLWNLTDMFSLNYHLYTAETIKADPQLAALVDLDHDGVFSEFAEGEAFIDQLDIIFDVSYSGTPSFSSSSPSASINIAPGRYARLIVLVDRESSNFMKIAWDGPQGALGWVESFNGTVSQDKDGIFSSITPITDFRSIRQHFDTGVLACQPYAFDPETGEQVCEYPEDEALPLNNAAPTPILIR